MGPLEKTIGKVSLEENNNIEDIFRDKDKSIKIYLCNLFDEIINEDTNKYGKIFDKSFVDFLGKDEDLLNLLIENSKLDTNIGRFNSKKAIKEKFDVYKKFLYIEDTFKDKDMFLGRYISRLISEIRDDLNDEGDKSLILDDRFIDFLNKDKESLNSLIKNSKLDKNFVGQYIDESKNIIKKKFKDFKEIIDNQTIILGRFREIFVNSEKKYEGFPDDLYYLIDKVRSLNSDLNKDVLFSEGFLRYLNRPEIIKSFEDEYNKIPINNGLKQYSLFYNKRKLHKLIINEYITYQKSQIGIDDDVIHEQMRKDEIERDNRIHQSVHEVERETQEKGNMMIEDLKSALFNCRHMLAGGSIPSLLIGPGGDTANAVALMSMANVGDNSQNTDVGSSHQNTNIGDNSQNTDVGSSHQNTNIGDNSQTVKPINRNFTKPEDKTEFYQSILKEIANKVMENDGFKNVKKLLESRGGTNIRKECIVAYYMSLNLKEFGIQDEGLKNIILENSQIVKEYLIKNFKYDSIFQDKEKYNMPQEKINNIILEVNKSIKNAGDIGSKNYTNFSDFKNEVLSIVTNTQNIRKSLEDSRSGIDYITQKMDEYLKNSTVESDVKGKRGVALLYASIIHIDINNEDDLNLFMRTINGEQTKYTVAFSAFINEREERDYERRYNFAVSSLIERYERAQANIETRRSYGVDYIKFSRTSDNPQDQTGVQLASRIDNLDKKLSNYKIKKPRNEMSEHEKSALMYTAFETTFNNTFNTNDIIVQKLVDLKIDLRSELTNYGIYDKEKNSFDENARNKFVKDRLLNTGFSIEEIETLGRTMKEFPDEIEKNKEILSSTDGFYTDEDNLEKISKIYALGEIIDNIRTLYSGQKLGNSMNLQLDEESPADIIGDCLFIKGKINGTETNIKYDLRTGKVYMNSFTEQILNPPKIIIGNTTPNTLIGDFGSFEDAISNMNSAFEIQNDENNNLGNSSNLGNISEDNNDSMEIKQNPEDLVKNKLDDNLKEIGKKVKDKTGKQTQENNIINNFLKTFGISSGTGESKEFTGGSKLYTILNNFMKIEDESDLIEISKLMKKLFRLFSLSRGEDNQILTENGSNLDQDDDSSSYDIESLSIFDIDKKHASEEIKYLQIETRKFFSDGNSEGGEKKKVEKLAHFDESVNISIIDVIVDKCCPKGELSKDNIKNYIVEIKNQIIDSRNNSKLMADAGRVKELENIMDNIA